PDADDALAKDFDAAGRVSRSVFDDIRVPPEADFYVCGPTRFMTDVGEALTALGAPPDRIRVELFNGSESITPGVVGAPARAPHPPTHETAAGPLVSFARSGIAARWDASSY